MDPLFAVLPEDIAALDIEALEAFVSEAQDLVEQVTADPNAFVTEERPLATLLSETETAVEAIEAARAELASRTEDAPVEEAPVADDVDADAFAQLAARAR